MEKTPPISPAQRPVQPCPYWYACPYPPVENDEVDLREIWQALVDNRKLIALVTGVITTIALVVAFLLTPIYRAEVLLAPATIEKSNGVGGLAGQFSDIAALANIGVGGGDKTQEAIATLKSRVLTERFIKENNLLPILFEDGWDEDKKAWKERDPKKAPTLWQAYDIFDKSIRTISADRRTGLVTVAIEWKDPALAAAWANDLVERVNRQRQKEAIQEAESSIGYLHKQLTKTSSIEVEQAIYRLIEAQTKDIMVAQAREEFAFKVIDPAAPPEKKVKPKRALIVVTGFVMGLLGSILIVFIERWSRKAIKA